MADEQFREKLEAVLIRCLPDCRALLSVDRLSGGASQETYRLVIQTAGDEQLLAMRRAAGGLTNEPVAEHPGLEAEALLMQSARAVGVPAPEIYYVLTRDDGLGDGFIMAWLTGETLGARIVRSPMFAEIRSGLARECGRILARIHRIDLDETGLRDRLWEIPPGDFVEQTWARYRQFDTPHPMIDYTARWLLAHLPTHYETRLVHNDFRNGNLMLSPDGVVAVLDWEVAHIGDPMRDLGWICTNSWRFGGTHPVGGFGLREDLFQGYADESGQVIDPAQVTFWEIFGSFWWAVACLGMAEQYRHGPDQTVERPGIGRRSSEGQVDCVNLLIPGPVELVSPSSAFSSLDMPRTDELIVSVRDFLRDDVMAQLQGRSNFLARVAANSLDIVLRELALGPAHERLEHERLREMFASDKDLTTLRWRLVNDLRDTTRTPDALSLESEQLQHHLRQTVVNQIAIDQPGYSGFRTAAASSGKA